MFRFWSDVSLSLCSCLSLFLPLSSVSAVVKMNVLLNRERARERQVPTSDSAENTSHNLFVWNLSLSRPGVDPLILEWVMLMLLRDRGRAAPQHPSLRTSDCDSNDSHQVNISSNSNYKSQGAFHHRLTNHCSDQLIIVFNVYRHVLTVHEYEYVYS